MEKIIQELEAKRAAARRGYLICAAMGVALVVMLGTHQYTRALAVLALGGGAGWYFKIYRPKQQKAAEPEEDYSSYDEPDDYDDAPPWDVDDEDEGGDE